MIAPPRPFIISLAALFSSYHLILAGYTLDVPASPWPVVAAMIIYAGATVVSLWPTSPLRMPVWLAATNVLASMVISFLVLSQLDAQVTNSYATWSVAAVGTLMTITMVRLQPLWAWVGIVVLAVIVALWSNVFAWTSTGVIGGAVWVGAAQAISRSLARAERDSSLFVRTELDAAAWHAMQEAQQHEGRYRLEHMNQVAGPILRRILEVDGHLDEEERRECLYVEAAIRDEIRGRSLLSQDVRNEVMAARRRGIEVTLLDDGGLDDLADESRTRIQQKLAEEIRRSQANRLIVRTGFDKKRAAVTVVGLKVGSDRSAAPLGLDQVDDELTEWVELSGD